MIKITRTFDAYMDESATEGVYFILNNKDNGFNGIIFSDNKKLLIKLSKLTGKDICMTINGGVRYVYI